MTSSSAAIPTTGRLLPTFSLSFQFSLAQLYHNGIGMTQDLKVALSLYEVFQEEF